MASVPATLQLTSRLLHVNTLVIPTTTGTSKGIGYDASLHLARAGHEVIATMHNPSASDLGEVTERQGLGLSTHALDVNDSDPVTHLFSAVGDVDVLINNAGIRVTTPSKTRISPDSSM